MIPSPSPPSLPLSSSPSLSLPSSLLPYSPPSLSSPLPFLSPFPLPPLKSRPLNTAIRSGKRCKLPQRGLGWRQRKSNLVHFSLKIWHGGTNFTNFPENQLTTVYAFFLIVFLTNFSSGYMHPSTLCLWVHLHPRHPVSRRLYMYSWVAVFVLILYVRSDQIRQ